MRDTKTTSTDERFSTTVNRRMLKSTEKKRSLIESEYVLEVIYIQGKMSAAITPSMSLKQVFLLFSLRGIMASSCNQKPHLSWFDFFSIYESLPMQFLNSHKKTIST